MSDRSVASSLPLSRPDYLLLLLPPLFLTVYGAGRWVVEARTPALAVAALACCLLVADGLFFHPPDE